jgi:DNA polymerase-3 subunit beta
LLGDTDERASVQWGARSIVLTFGGIEIRSKLVDGKYPEYERVVPRGLERTAVVGRDAMRAALQRAAILSNEKYKGVRVSFGAGGLALQAQNPEHEVAEDEVAAEYDGETVTIGFNVSYLMDALQAIDAERVEVGFKDSDSSTIWRGEGRTGETFVVMPMRL